MKVKNTKKGWEYVSDYMKPKETWQLNVKLDPGLDPGPRENI